ncbi:hypothetical protein [Aeromonas veronii]|uniref:hypothetical protein n=1 Tax=Aeromonas veronii TaxID=654 RepID=UPI0018EF2D0E|nr:hypothetical protein [Aeromonas veronii]
MDLDDSFNIVKITAKCASYVSDDETVKSVTEKISKHSTNIKNVAKAGTVGAAVTGASGASIMSTLASAGALVGGGVVAGVGIVAGSAGVGAASVLNDTVFDESEEAQIGTYTGAAVGTAGSLGALAIAGAGPTGLATIGSLVGGGMAAGAVGLIAAPIVGAVLVGTATYFIFKNDEPEPLPNQVMKPEE